MLRISLEATVVLVPERLSAHLCSRKVTGTKGCAVSLVVNRSLYLQQQFKCHSYKETCFKVCILAVKRLLQRNTPCVCSENALVQRLLHKFHFDYGTVYKARTQT